MKQAHELFSPPTDETIGEKPQVEINTTDLIRDFGRGLNQDLSRIMRVLLPDLEKLIHNALEERIRDRDESRQRYQEEGRKVAERMAKLTGEQRKVLATLPRYMPKNLALDLVESMDGSNQEDT